MAKYAPPSIWTDEYNAPTVEGLRKLLLNDCKKAFDKASSKIHAFGEITEEVLWFGDCWFWTVAFMTEHSSRPLAIIVPFEEDMQIASPMSHQFIDQLSTRRLKRMKQEITSSKTDRRSYGAELILDLHHCNPDTFTRSHLDKYFTKLC